MVDDKLMEFIDKGKGSIYIDDIVIHTDRTEEEHKAIIHKWLTKLEKLNLFLKLSKCEFHKKEVKYLGMIVGNGAIRMDPVKVQGITQWLTPLCIKDVRSFLGFCNFYRAFISNFSNITRPLNDLTCKNCQWDWSADCEKAFQHLKQICASEPVLKTPNWSKPFVMHTDTSGYALGVVIAQEHDDSMHPIAFHSWSLLPAERNYDIHDRELAGIVFGFKCGHPLFLSAQHPMRILMDHKNLQYFHKPQKVTRRQARWIEFLQDFDYSLEHIAGTTNTIADLLSHQKDLNKGVDSDLPCTLLPDHLFSSPLPPDALPINKTFVEDDPETRRQLLKSLHDSPAAGHPGIANTWELVREHYEGPHLCQFVEEYVKGCAQCQESKTNVHQSKAPLQCFNTPVEEGPFQYISMDLIMDLPKSQGFNSVLMIVDQGCSKATKFIPCNKMIDSPGVANEYLKHLVPWFGLPKHIISDHDPCFTSAFTRKMCRALGIQQNLSTAFHP